ncbi:CocE/NonD family hydrolase [Oceanicoccus sagamiensis]|uniref:Xaa-Pro dipeptidyl-peptidase C-terminal domain-containing protein n=1 Tax=Oceanicoccus sagamiensis TaxID=716816 RepID=A0A1X9NE31_9GAMM|nr:CocE/NonD family hydrolase [Oceanicoccus sagamiensis]ARN73799.1 hypothetical protein BST96_06545 [Oceanicoccus sagamiensis]
MNKYLNSILAASTLIVAPLLPAQPQDSGAILSAKASLTTLGSTIEVEGYHSDNPPKALYPTVRLEQSVRIPMRDGVRLATDFYFPQGEKKKRPIILIRFAYNKNHYRKTHSIAYFFAAQGYVVAVQDIRGKFESEGRYRISADDRDDGYDTLNWLASQPWASGKIGTFGCSYSGENQMQLAATRHPNHTTAIAESAGGAYLGTYRPFMYREGGVPELANSLGWFWGAGNQYPLQLPAALTDSQFQQFAGFYTTAPTLPALDINKAVWTLPVIDSLRANGNPLPNEYDNYIAQPPAAPYWDSLNYVTDQDRFNIPALHINSWYDGSANETLKLFNLFRRQSDTATARDNQFVIISPTTHCGSAAAGPDYQVAGLQLGDPSKDYLALYLRWFNYWLKGEDNAVLTMPRVSYYLMGANQWAEATSWPLAKTHYQPYFLTSQGAANRGDNHGQLIDSPAEQTGQDNYRYDPADPVPSSGGFYALEPCPSGDCDKPPSQTRQDVLVYHSAPLNHQLDIVGEISAELYIASSAKDTDFTVRLLDQHPDGRAYLIQEGILRARYWQGFDRPQSLQAERIYQLSLSLHATAYRFHRGHTIRVEVSSSNFPRYSRNLNTGGRNYDEVQGVVANNTLYHGQPYPSHITLPVIKPQVNQDD